MAQALKEGRAIHGAEIVAERPDGTSATVLAYPTPLRDSAGRLVGAVNILMDVTDRKAAEVELRRRQDDLEDFFENSVVGLHWVASDGTILRANRAELELLGYEREEYVGRHISAFHADPATIEDILTRLSRGERLDKYPARLLAKDGAIRHVMISSNVQFQEGQFVKSRCFTLDVTNLMEAEERRKLLINELNHRVKNTLATVQSIAAQTLRTTPAPGAFSRSFSDRLLALSRTHDHLNRENWRGASLRAVLTTELAPFCPSPTGRVSLRGDDVRLSPRGALTLGMALHELTTNAVKYGALSTPAGRISVVWTVSHSQDSRVLRLTWKELDGPSVKPPSRQGFGLRLIERGLAHELGGDAQVAFETDGLRCDICFALPDGGAP